MKTITAISSGCYSDYSVGYIFEDPEDAEAWVKALNEGRYSYLDEFETEEFTLVPKGTKVEHVTEYEISATLRPGGVVANVNESSEEIWEIDCKHDHPSKRPTVYVSPLFGNNRDSAILRITGSTHESVRKVFSERTAAWKAGSWIIGPETQKGKS